jgi:release factor glutamine methyltransferase
VTDAAVTARVVARLRGAGSVWAEDEAALLVAEATGARLEDLVARRVAGEPLETVLGWVEFAGRRLTVRRGMFVPRRRTELLARVAADRLPPGGVLLELCSGVAPVAAYAGAGAGEVHVSDLDPAALACARENVPAAQAHLGDLYAALPADLAGRVDVLAANAPYVPSDGISTMPREARDHEPHAALDGGPDGVDMHRRIAAGAPGWLRPGGVLAIETGAGQAALTAAAMADAGLAPSVVRDEGLDATVVVGVLR